MTAPSPVGEGLGMGATPDYGLASDTFELDGDGWLEQQGS